MKKIIKVLVTGGTGFIGSNLVDALIKKGYQVRILVHRSRESLIRREVELIKGDIRDLSELKKAMEGIDAVFHLAALMDIAKAKLEDYLSINVIGTKNVFQAAQEAQVKKIIYIGSVGVWGPIKNPPADENYPYNPVNKYDISKYQAEKIAWRYIKTGLPVCIVRPTIVYGPGDTHSAVFNLFKLIRNRMFYLVGSGQALIHVTHIRNLTDALINVLENNKALGKDYIIADEKYVSWEYFCKTIANELGVKLNQFHIPKILALTAGTIFDWLKILGIKTPLSCQAVRFLTTNHAYSIKKAVIELGYQPRINLKSGIKETVDWYRQNNYLN